MESRRNISIDVNTTNLQMMWHTAIGKRIQTTKTDHSQLFKISYMQHNHEALKNARTNNKKA